MPDHDNPTQATEDRARLIALGNRYLEAGYLHAAHDAFAAAGSKDKLIAVGDRFLQSGIPHSAKDAYIAAGKQIAREEIVAALLEQPAGPSTASPKQPIPSQVTKPRTRRSSRSSLVVLTAREYSATGVEKSL